VCHDREEVEGLGHLRGPSIYGARAFAVLGHRGDSVVFTRIGAH
jgi:hypothetical protein